MQAAATLLLAATGCTDRDLSAVDPDRSSELPKVIPVSENRKVDLLFVVDDSSSMRQEQASLAVNFPLFIEVIESVAGGLPDLHLGVVSTNVGTGIGNGDGSCVGVQDNGVLQVPEDCPPLTDGTRFISDVVIDEETGARLFNYTGSLADQFSCMARLGTDGCGFEQPLEAAARALENRDQNAGFLRDDAFLMIVFLTDEDDCSAIDPAMFDPSQDDRDAPLGELSSFRCFEFGTTCAEPDERALGPRTGCVPGDDDTGYMTGVAPYVERIKALKERPSRVIVAAISADQAPVSVGVNPDSDQLRVDPACVVCPGGAATGCPLDPTADGAALVAATPAIRLRAFLDSFPQRATWQNICTYDPAIGDVNLAGALVQIAISFGQFPVSWCLDDRIALPPECSVTEVTDPGTADEEQTVIPPCDQAAPTCFRLVEDPTCATSANLSLEIERDGPRPTDPTEIVVRCLAR